MRDGVRFDAAISPSSWSAPSHTTIITGMQPYHHKIMGWNQTIDAGVSPLAVILKQAGYSTGMFSSHYALHAGIQEITAGLDTRFIARNEDDSRVLLEARRWATLATQPYFLYICLMTPHAPYTKYPPSYDEKYFTDMPPGGETVFPFTPETWIGKGGIPRSVRLGDHNELGYYINRYDRGVRYVDFLVGQFWQSMQAAGLLEDTIVVITADHGEGLGEHGSFAHELYLYDFLVRVPLIVYYPKAIPKGQQWRTQVSLADIVPTTLGLSGIAVPEDMDGWDLSRWLVSATRPNGSRLITGTYRWRGYDRYMVRSDRYKLIYDVGDEREEFYDLATDRTESNNLIGAQLPVDEYETLRAELEKLISRHEGIDPERVDKPPDAELMEKLRSLGYVRVKKLQPQE